MDVNLYPTYITWGRLVAWRKAAGEGTEVPILQEQGKALHCAGHGNIWGVLLVELFIPGGRVLLLGVSKQHH